MRRCRGRRCRLRRGSRCSLLLERGRGGDRRSEMWWCECKLGRVIDYGWKGETGREEKGWETWHPSSASLPEYAYSPFLCQRPQCARPEFSQISQAEVVEMRDTIARLDIRLGRCIIGAMFSRPQALDFSKTSTV